MQEFDYSSITDLPFTEEELAEPFKVTSGLNGETYLNGELVPPEKKKELEALLEKLGPLSFSDDDLDF